MKICKSGFCPVENVAKCYIYCDKKATCEDVCIFYNWSDCVNIQEVENSLAAFQGKEIALINAISSIEQQKKAKQCVKSCWKLWSNMVLRRLKMISYQLLMLHKLLEQLLIVLNLKKKYLKLL